MRALIVGFIVLAGFLCFEDTTALHLRHDNSETTLNSDETEETKQATSAPEEKPKGIKRVKKEIKRFLRKLGFTTDKCEAKKESGGTPSAVDGDSPIDTFGYPHFDQSTGETILRAQVPLSVIEGFPQPIIIGAKDYVVQGTGKEILKFLLCFDQYNVIGEKLGDDGSWHKDGDIGPIYAQVQKVASVQGDVFDILAGYTLDKIVDEIGVLGIIDATIGNWWEPATDISGKAKRVMEVFKQLKDRMPKLTKEEFEKFWNRVSAASGTGKLKEVAKFLGLVETASDAVDKWDNPKDLTLSTKMTLYLTSYPRRSETLSTYTFSSNKITLGEVGDALTGAVGNDSVTKVLLKLQFDESME